MSSAASSPRLSPDVRDVEPDGGVCVMSSTDRLAWYVLDDEDAKSWSCQVTRNEHGQPVFSLWAQRRDDPQGGWLVRLPLSAHPYLPHDIMSKLVWWLPAGHMCTVHTSLHSSEVACVWAWKDIDSVRRVAPFVVEIGEPYNFAVMLRPRSPEEHDATVVHVQSWHDSFIDAFMQDDFGLVA